MEKQWVRGAIGLGALLIILAGISPVVAMATPSFGTEDWVGPKEQAPIMVMATPSFGTEDWVGPKEQAPIMVMATPSFGTEDWVGTMKSSEALGAGALPAPVRE